VGLGLLLVIPKELLYNCTMVRRCCPISVAVWLGRKTGASSLWGDCCPRYSLRKWLIFGPMGTGCRLQLPPGSLPRGVVVLRYQTLFYKTGL